MSLFKLFSGPTAAKLEEKGDALMAAKNWGEAKLVYERALDKLAKQTGHHARDHAGITDKIQSAVQALVQDHRNNAALYLEGSHYDEACDLLELAMEITRDQAVKQQVKEQLQWIEQQQMATQVAEEPDYLYDLDDDTEEDDQEEDDQDDVSDEEYFLALCGPLPESVRDAYMSYGDAFTQGYIALNGGDFPAAAENLQQAMTEHPQPDSFIPLELAAAYLNLNRLDEAQILLEGFLRYHPETLPAYQLLCDIYWERGNYEGVDALLAAVPDDLADSVAVVLLKGESLFQAGRLKSAADLYTGFTDVYGWYDAVSRELAKVYEALKEWEKARRIYKEIITRCNSCQSRIDPVIKHQYAELSFNSGDYSAHILEIYLALVREVPDNAAHYYDRISRIYTVQGNTEEAARFHGFSIRASQKRAQN